MFTVISNFQELIKARDAGINVGGAGKFLKLDNWGGEYLVLESNMTFQFENKKVVYCPFPYSIGCPTKL